MKKAVKSMNRRHLMDFSIAGFSYYEGCMALSKLKPGTTITLVREEDNKFDPYAVSIYYNDFKLGFVPRDENELLSKFLEMGYDDIFEARVQRVTPNVHPEQQVSVIVYLIKEKDL
jgi:hypothetical protein